MTLKEGYLLDYMIPGFLGFIFGVLSLGTAAGNAGDLVRFTGVLIVADIFYVIPGGMVAAYVNFKFHKVSERLEMAGLSCGLFTATIYTIITLFQTIISAALSPATAGSLFVGWIISVIFAFIFFMIGGYFAGYLERKPFAMPTIFDMSRISSAPPPPPPAMAAQTCPTCGSPLRYIQQYQRWYCDKEQKYV
jgi:pheromone shutdown protein TraB